MKWLIFLFFVALPLFSLQAEDSQKLSYAETLFRVREIDVELDALKKWQGQYRRKYKSYLTKASRLQFKNSTETKQYRVLAEEANENVLALQDQINLLNAQKEHLLK